MNQEKFSIQSSRVQNKSKNTKEQKIYDLEERLKQFFIRVVKLCKKVPLDARSSRIVSQLISSSGSIAANFAEATEAMSKKDFVKSIKISRKEAKESRVWLSGLKVVVEFDDPEFDTLYQEASEFVYIFSSILKKHDAR